MSIYPNKLTIIDGDKTFLCPVFSTEAEAKPQGGKALKVGVIVDNSVKDGYMGLTSTQLPTSAPLRAVIDGVDYYFSTVGNQENPDDPSEITVKINPSAHQTIRFTCNGISEDVTTEPKTFIVPAGAEYSIEIIPVDGYVAGELNVPAEGIVSKALENITVTDAIPFKVLITITQVDGVTITVNGHTSTFEANYGDPLEYAVTYDAHHRDGVLSIVKTGTEEVYSDNVVKVPLTFTVSDVKEDEKFTVTLEKSEGLASVVMEVEGTEISSGDKVYAGSELKITATPKEHYATPRISINEE